jgi:hypothetical protein
LHDGKETCVIIDLIGNNRNADIKLGLFHTEHADGKGKHLINPVVPEFCAIELDVRVIDLLKEMLRKTHPRRDRLFNNYHVLKNEIGRRPSYLELHLRGASETV